MAARLRKEWLKPLVDQLVIYDRDIAVILSKAADDIDDDISALIAKSGPGARMRESQLREIRSMVSKRLNEIYASNFDLIKHHQAIVAEIVTAIGAKRDHKIYKQLGLSKKDEDELVTAMVAGASRNIQAVVARHTRTKKLIKTIDKSKLFAKAMVDRRIDSGLVKGDGADQIAKDIRGLLDPATPGGVSYAAKRIGRTEIGNAFHAQAQEDSINKPWIESVSWNLSRSHPVGSGCLCEKYALKGKYDPEKVPDKPHPQCLCYITPNVKPWEVVLAEVEDSRYDSWLEEHR